MITVVCARPSHAAQPVTAGAFRRADDGSWIEAGHRTGVALDGDTPSDVDGARLRYRLRCRACGLSVPVRGERLGPVLDRLAAAGVTTVSLSGLAGTVR